MDNTTIKDIENLNNWDDIFACQASKDGANYTLLKEWLKRHFHTPKPNLLEKRYLQKYSNSRFNGEKILYIEVDSNSENGEITIVTENQSKCFNIDSEYLDYNADGIICLLQGHRNIDVSKY